MEKQAPLADQPRSERQVHFGAVYFRKTNPPRQDWERDYGVAAEDGHTMFRQWFPWGAIEIAPGVYDWEDYDIHLDLAAKNGIDTIIAEMITDVPEWLYHRYPHARREMMDGRRRTSEMHVSCVTGGHHAMCLDNPEVSEPAGRFLQELAQRYRNHPGLYGYDIWNECSNYHPDLNCYCPATQARFREWLKQKYGDLASLAKAWLRYSFTSWEEVELPRKVGPYPDVIDAIAFQNDNAFYWMKWRADILRGADPAHPVVAHGNAKSFCDIAPASGDDWRAGELVDIFGYTYWYANECHSLLAGDMIRSASGDKEFWRAEAIGDSDWEDRRAERSPETHKDEMADPLNIRLDCMLSLTAGARGFINPRWRPLLDGPLYGAYGWYGMDGRRTERSDMVASLATWANRPVNEALWKSRPVRGEAAVLLLEEAQAYCYARYGNTDYYSLSIQGAYEAFLHANVQCDMIKLEQIHDYSFVYVVYPVALKDSTVSTLLQWVNNGGTLVGEAGFGYFTEHAHALPEQPSRGLEALFGCREKRVSFGADRWNELAVQIPGGRLAGGLYRQAYELAGGEAAGWFDDGEIAIVDHRYGQGRARLIGTMLGYGYKRRPEPAASSWFAALLGLGGQQPGVRVDKPDIVARLSRLDDRYFLWVVNQGEDAKQVAVSIDDGIVTIGEATALRGSAAQRRSPNTLVVDVAGRDASIFSLN
ncbi:beta-galactosidase [Cohnella cellulosilytica]|uniref:beta-galactosidase n=1 Tax=Cohnella cellulosilytica TaxID=986710 RepID=A0ABW2FGW8_9BACL